MDISQQNITYYKDLLRQAVEVSPKLDIQTKQKVLELKNKLVEYAKLVNEYTKNISDLNPDHVWEEQSQAEVELKYVHDDLLQLGKEVLEQINAVKGN